MPTKMSDMSALRRLPPNDGDDADSETEGRPSYIIENKGQYVTVLQTFKNIAPIVDAAFVDVDGTEQVSFHLSKQEIYQFGIPASDSYMFWRKEYRVVEHHS